MIYCLSQIIEMKAKEIPNKVAFKYNDQSVTYSELWQKTNIIASYLQEKGVKKGDRVGIFLNRSLETAAAIYGIMLAGAAYVPLDPEAPSVRNAFIISDCGINVLLTNDLQKRRLSKLPLEEIEIKLVIGTEINGISSILWDELYAGKQANPVQVTLLDEDLAYILYTSGSTGHPKGIMHSHRSGLGYAALSVDYFDITYEDVLANHAAINFDISTLGYFAGPLAGATTVIVPDAHTKMPASLVQLILQQKISIWYSVPHALIQLLDQEKLSEAISVRWILFAGEAFPTPRLRELMNKIPNTSYCNIYGPTEVNGCTYYEVKDTPAGDEPIAIGKPWPNTEILIVNEENEEVQRGEVGELTVRTITSMIGYWGNRVMTNRSFLKIESETGLEKLYYKTGDLVFENIEGDLVLLGRKDHQVKIRGYRIELEEINSIIWKHPAVEEVVAYLVNDGNTEKVINASLVTKNKIDSDEIKSHCSQYLPAYAIPEQFIFLDKIPRNQRGKVDFEKLKSIS